MFSPAAKLDAITSAVMFAGLKLMWLKVYPVPKEGAHFYYSLGRKLYRRTARLICAYCNRMKLSVIPAI